MNSDRRKGPKSSQRLLDRSILLDEREGPPLVGIGLVFGSAMVVLFIVWASLVGLEEMETAVGSIVPSGDSYRLQHASGGIVAELLVKEGSTVKLGQSILRLDPRDSESLRQQTKSRLYALQAQKARLQGLLDGQSPLFTNLPSEAFIFITDQQAIYQAVLAQRRAAEEMVDSQISQAVMESERIVQRRTAIQRQLVLAEEDAALTQALVEKGAASRTEMLGKQRTVESLKAEAESLEAEEGKSKEKAEELRRKLSEFRASAKTQLREELASVNELIAQAMEQDKRLSTNTERLEVLAPVDGVVHALDYRTVGEVVPPGATIMQILPLGKIPRAEIQINPKSIGSVKIGNEARVKVSAYPFDRYGAFQGTLVEVSASTFINQNGQAYYRGIIDITGRELQDAEPLDLVSGMTVIAELKTGEKTMIEYLLKPVFASAQEAFREK